MFNRQEIKANAKFVLGRSYWTALLVTFLASLVGGSATSFGGRVNVDVGNVNVNVNTTTTDLQNFEQSLENGGQSLQQFFEQYGAIFGTALGIGAITAIVISFAWMFFISVPAGIGVSRFFIATREQQNPVDFSYVLYGFKYNYLKQAWAFFSTHLILYCWSLLGLIPMIVAMTLSALTKEPAWMTLSVLACPCMIPAYIKTYQYRMVSYILANNSTINGKRARELSTAMTDGNKWNLFVLDLSFIGWFVLGILLCGIGIFFVIPYYNAANAEAYTCLKAEAMQNKGVSSEAELPTLAGAPV